jgi:hypothetical protein
VGISANRYAAKNTVATFENSFAWSSRSLLRPITAAYWSSYQYRKVLAFDYDSTHVERYFVDEVHEIAKEQYRNDAAIDLVAQS